MDNAIIQFESVSFTYSGEETPLPPAVDGVDVSFRKGELVAILGHNGSGKSTFAKLTNSILIPDTGRVTVNGMDTADDNNLDDIRRTVGMVFQNPDNQIVATIVEDDVAFGPENLGVEPKEIRRRVDEALKSVGMYAFREHEPHKLSGGQKQRVAIAGVVAMQTQCIVMDEPTAMLDPKGRSEVMQTIHRLQRELGITVIFVTHFMDEAVQADRVLVMHTGKILLDGTPQEVFSQVELLQNAGLQIPPAALLCHRLRQQGIALAQGILTKEDCIRALLQNAGGNA